MKTFILVLVASLTSVAFAQSSFALSDISSSPHKEAIERLVAQGVLQGYSDGTFKPTASINRAELLKMLVANTGTPSVTEFNSCFSDVSTQWFAPYVCYAKAQGWVQGYSDGTFKPAQTVNSAEALKMLIHSQGIAVMQPTHSPLPNVAQSEWFAPYVYTALQNGILAQDAYFIPGSLMNRETTALYVYRSQDAVVERPRDYIGLPVRQAEELALDTGEMFRVVQEDGQNLPVTEDYRPGRINAVVRDGIVVAYTIEGEEMSSSSHSSNSSTAEDYIGLTVSQATDLALARGTRFRVVMQDGESLPVTMDYMVGRINATVNNGIVTSYTVEGQESYDANSWKTMIDVSCTSFNDGCNTCNRMPGSGLAACTKMYCATYNQPYCLE